ncbi:MAG: ABC-ATPase domain-containing protein [Oscillospiraceae bacterium]|nr:ABC-ATPase domain-containing protein [Oscillospiraceae bacterium]
MNRFKRIIMALNTLNKSRLDGLYATKGPYEPPKIFEYEGMKFEFSGTNYRTPEKQIMEVYIPLEMLKITDLPKDLIPLEDYVLRNFSNPINELGVYVNKNKYRLETMGLRNIEKCHYQTQTVNEIITKRNGAVYDSVGYVYDYTKKSICIRIHITMSLINGLSIDSKSTLKKVKELLDLICDKVTEFNFGECKRHIETYKKQQYIRKYLTDNGYIAFVANGSILPRYNGTAIPLTNAIPFVSPSDNEIKIYFDDGTAMTGMGIKKGITVITGGGYSGKSTLLDAIESGIYNHIPGDGREFVITNDTALKIYAEDGRPVNNLDMSPFYRYFPGNANVKAFSTTHASGSVSQAANIIEAVYAGSKLLLIDEDRSATNFMIRDKNMRLVVEKEPIIPYTDRIRELYESKDVSTILVIGGSSEYLSYADKIILMEDYKAKDITNYVKTLDSLPKTNSEEQSACWTSERYMIPIATTKEFIYFRTVTTENAKKIILDEYSADITLITSLISDDQLSMLAYIMEQLLGLKETSEELPKIINNLIRNEEINVSSDFKAECWFEHVRSLDIFCAVSRLRGIKFK